MDELELLADRFEASRPQLRAVAYRMLGSVSEADDAVQETWLRLSRSRHDEVENLRAWLTTVVARVSLDMLRSRTAAARGAARRRTCPEPIVSREDGTTPSSEALLADSVGLALLVVLETLTPAERLAFVLHDMFGVPFDEIAPIVEPLARRRRDSSPAARGAACAGTPAPDADLAAQRAVVDAFLAAARDGDFDALLAVLDPDVVLRVDRGALRRVASRSAARGAVIRQAFTFARLASHARPALVNGAAGLVVRRGRPFARSRRSRSRAGGSSRSTSSPTRSACARSTCDRRDHRQCPVRERNGELLARGSSATQPERGSPRPHAAKANGKKRRRAQTSTVVGTSRPALVRARLAGDAVGLGALVALAVATHAAGTRARSRARSRTRWRRARTRPIAVPPVAGLRRPAPRSSLDAEHERRDETIEPRRRARRREPAERVGDDHDRAVAAAIAARTAAASAYRSPCSGTLARELDGADGAELGRQLIPAPRAVPGAVDQQIRRHGRNASRR